MFSGRGRRRRGKDDRSDEVDQARGSRQSLERRVEETSVSLVVQARRFRPRSVTEDGVFGGEEFGLDFEQALLVRFCPTGRLEVSRERRAWSCHGVQMSASL